MLGPNMIYSEFFAWVQRTKIFVQNWKLTDCKVQRTAILGCRNDRCFGALHLNGRVLVHIYKDLGALHHA